MLTLDRKNNVLVPWYNRKFAVDSSGQKMYFKPYEIGSWRDEYFRLDDQRIVEVKSDTENMKKGFYLHYSEEQKTALIRLCFYLKKNFKTFSFDKVFGHDSVAPNRKNDPGGCLGLPGEVKPVSIPEFQKYLKQNYR